MKIVLRQKYISHMPQIIDDEPCELYDSCADIMTPKEAMLKMLATGQQVDLNRRQAFYDSEELEDYIEAEYPCDYITAYKEYMDEVKRPRMRASQEQSTQEQSAPHQFKSQEQSAPHQSKSQEQSAPHKEPKTDI